MKKATRNLMIAVSMMFISIFAIMSVDAAEHHYKGDVNRDDIVDVSDVKILSTFLTSSDSYFPKDGASYADLNSDGKVNVYDLIILKRIAAGKSQPTEDPAFTTTAVTTTTDTTTTITTTAVETTTNAQTTTDEQTTVTTTISAIITTPMETTSLTTTSTIVTTTSTEAETTTTISETTVTVTETDVVSTDPIVTTTNTSGEESYQIAPASVDRVMFDATMGNWTYVYQDSAAFENDTADADGSIFDELIIPEIDVNNEETEYTAKMVFKEDMVINWLGLEIKPGSSSSLSAWNTKITVTELIIDGVSYDLTANEETAKITLIGYGTPIESGASIKSVQVKYKVRPANNW